MSTVSESTIVEAPIEAVWDVLRDFNGHDVWHPAVVESAVERELASDRVGCVRRFSLADGSELRERLLALSDAETSFSYCLLDTPVPLFNYVAHVQLLPVTDGDHTFWQWRSDFDTRAGEREKMRNLVTNDIYLAGFNAIKAHLGLAAQSTAEIEQ